MYKCIKCSNEISITETKSIPRNTSCDNCTTDIRSCIFCRFYDQSKHNECSEPSADRVVDKEKANFCDYYEFNTSQKVLGKNNNKSDALKKLADLFK